MKMNARLQKISEGQMSNIMDAFRKIVKGEMMSIAYVSAPKLPKKNPFYMDCYKETRITCMGGVNYGNSINNALKRNGIEGQTFEVASMSGKRHIDDYIAVALKDETQFYLCLQKVRGNDAKSVYKHIDGREFTKEEIEAIKPYIQKSESAKQEGYGLFGDKQIKPFQIKVENLLWFKQGELACVNEDACGQGVIVIIEEGKECTQVRK